MPGHCVHHLRTGFHGDSVVTKKAAIEYLGASRVETLLAISEGRPVERVSAAECERLAREGFLTAGEWQLTDAGQRVVDMVEESESS